MKRISSIDSDFKREFDELLQRGKMDIEGVSKIVLDILANIKSRGDEAIKDDIKSLIMDMGEDNH